MKTQFTQKYSIEGREYYLLVQVLERPYIENETITLKDVLTSDLSIEGKFGWLVKSCALTKDEKVLLAVKCAKIVLHLFENKYPDDLRPRQSIEAVEEYLRTHEITVEAANRAGTARAAANIARVAADIAGATAAADHAAKVSYHAYSAASHAARAAFNAGGAAYSVYDAHYPYNDPTDEIAGARAFAAACFDNVEDNDEAIASLAVANAGSDYASRATCDTFRAIRKILNTNEKYVLKAKLNQILTEYY